MKTMFCFFQGIGSAELILGLLIFPALCLGMFLALRAIMLWYWKINTLVENQQIQIKLLQDLLSSFNKNRPQ